MKRITPRTNRNVVTSPARETPDTHNLALAEAMLLYNLICPSVLKSKLSRGVFTCMKERRSKFLYVKYLENKCYIALAALRYL